MHFEETLTCKDAIARWDSGSSIWTIEMGGLGPGYEQAIQIMVVEILRDAIKAEEEAGAHLTLEQFKEQSDKTISFHDDALGGVTGAMAGAAKNLSYRAYNVGWTEMLRKAQEQGIKDNRFIQVSKRIPQAA